MFLIRTPRFFVARSNANGPVTVFVVRWYRDARSYCPPACSPRPWMVVGTKSSVSELNSTNFVTVTAVPTVDSCANPNCEAMPAPTHRLLLHRGSTNLLRRVADQ